MKPDALRSLEEEIRLLDERLNRVESSAIFRFLRFAGRLLERQRKFAGQILLHSPFHPLYLRLRGSSTAKLDGVSYPAWIAARETRRMSASRYSEEAGRWRLQPLVSVVLSTYRPQRLWLERAIESVKAQSYAKWQLCVCDDASDEPWIREYLESEAATDSRIRVTFRESNGGISEGLNSAGALATGEYVAFLDHDDELHPHALFHVIEAAQGGADVLYSDEDYLDSEGARTSPTFKPDWSPELLDSCMYFGHLLVARRELIEQVGWFRKLCDGAQDYDLALRLVERAREVRHVRQVLYHWRQHSQSTSLNPAAKPYAHEAGRRALADAMERRGIAAKIDDGPLLYTFAIRREFAKPPISLIVCTRDAKRLSAFLNGQKKTRYPKVEIVVVEHLVPGGGRLAALLGATECVRVPYAGDFNFSTMCNLGAAAATWERLVFVNDDVTPNRVDWLEVLAAYLESPEIGAVGARMLYPSGALQHSGMTFGIQDGAGHPGRGEFASPLMYYLQLPRNVSAVTGACLGIRKGVFQEIGEFDLAFPDNYGDLDLCLRIREKGYRIVVDPRIELTHVECATRKGGTTFAERQRFRLRWGHVLAEGDPYYPEAFDKTTEVVRLAAL
jgi:GT2 family glycosyltransferase